MDFEERFDFIIYLELKHLREERWADGIICSEGIAGKYQVNEIYPWLNQMIIIKWEFIALSKVSRVFSYSKIHLPLPKGNASTRLPTRNLLQRITSSSKRLPTFLKRQGRNPPEIKHVHPKVQVKRLILARQRCGSCSFCCSSLLWTCGHWTNGFIWRLSSVSPITILPQNMNIRIMPLLVWTADWQVQLTGHLSNSWTNVLRCIIRTPCPASWPQHHHSQTTCLPRSVPRPWTHGRNSLLAPAPLPEPLSCPPGPCSGPPNLIPSEHHTPLSTWMIWLVSHSWYFPHFSLMSISYSESEEKINYIIIFPSNSKSNICSLFNRTPLIQKYIIDTQSSP